MKKLSFLFCMLLISAFTFSQWTWQNPLPQGNTLLSTYFTSPTVGYTVGEHGTILKTTDGGITWNQQISGTINSLNSVFFTSVDTGYVAGGYSGELILKTTNGGNSWETQYIDSTLPSSLYSIFFLNSNLGFAVGYNGTILKTIDGGTTWTPKFSGTTDLLISIYFTDINTGYVVGTNGTILKTTNAGNSWTAQSSGTMASLCSVFFTDPNTGYISASTQILKTSNGGITWTPYSVGTTYGIGTIYFTDLDTGYAVSATNIYKTTDAGITWSAQNTGTTNWLKSVFFADNNTGYTVGDYGTIIKTTDSGISWNTLTIGTTNNLCSVFFTENSTGYIVGAEGIILKTINGGSNWIEKTSGTTDTLRSVYFIDSNTGYAVGNSGTIIKTTDAGNTWITQTTGVFYNLYSVFMIDPNTGYAVGKGGMIVKTTNGGNTWDPISFNVYGDLTSVYFTDANTGYAVGVSGKIIKTINGGNTWTIQSSGTVNDLNSIYFTDNNTGFIVGIAGTILKTTNGGNNWITDFSGMNYWMYSVHFKDSITGYAVGCGTYGGIILKTTNGGNSWNIEPFTEINPLSSVFVTNSGTCYAVGFYGAILSSSFAPLCNVSFQSMSSPSGYVDFTATPIVSDSTAYPLSYVWTFGDGTSSTTNFDTISHIYNSSGFLACVTMQTANGCTSTYCDTISINPTNQCQAGFYYYLDSITVPPINPYVFVDQSVSDSTGTVVSWNWTFPGGNPATSFLQNPVVNYPYSGTYFICLTINTSNGCTSTFCDSIYIPTAPPQCQAGFTVSSFPDIVTHSFTNTSIPDTGSTIVSYFWDFGDGTSSTLQNPTHTYPGTGAYTICLSIVTSSGCTSTHCHYINIYVGPTPCSTYFIASPDSLNVPPMTTYSFFDQSVPDSSFIITNWSWTFPGGIPATSALQNPQGIAFINPGTYTVCLTTTTSSGCTSTFCNSITVSNIPCQLYVDLSIQNPTIIGGNDGYIESSVYGGTPPYAYSWSTGQTTANIYNLTSGLYLLNVTDANGCLNSFTAQLFEPYDTIGGPIVDTLTTNIIDTCLNFVPDSFNISTVTIDSINNLVTVSWVFSGGGMTLSLTVTYQYFISGNNAVIITINCGNKNLTSYMSYIHISAAVGIESVDFNRQNILAYPVPFTDLLNVEFRTDKLGDVNIYLLDATGRIVVNKTIHLPSGVNSTDLNTSSLPSGFYILNIENNGQIIRKSVVK